MTEVPQEARTATLARVLENKIAQGHTIESRTETEAVIALKGRKRMFGKNEPSRQRVTVDDTGSVMFRKIEATDGGGS